MKDEILRRYRVNDRIDTGLDDDSPAENTAPTDEPVASIGPMIPVHVHMRLYQMKAIEEWTKRNYVGIFDMATGMDVKTLSATIGHVSSATTLDIYSHITDTMQRQAAVHIDRKIGGTDAQMPTAEPSAGQDTVPIEFTPYKPKIRKPGTGCVTMINDHLYEGRYTPTNAYGKRESHNIYAKTREECEEKLAEMIAEVKAQIKAEKEKMTG